MVSKLKLVIKVNNLKWVMGNLLMRLPILKNTKYIILLRVLETMTPFVTLVIASGPRAILKSVFPVFCSLCFLYIVILIIEFFRKKISMRELIINSVFCFIDVSLVIIGLVAIFRF